MTLWWIPPLVTFGFVCFCFGLVVAGIMSRDDKEAGQ